MIQWILKQYQTISQLTMNLMKIILHKGFNKKSILHGWEALGWCLHTTYLLIIGTGESVHLTFLIAALNKLDIHFADIGKAYQQAPICEKVCTTIKPEFGPQYQGKTVVIVHAMYWLKPSGAAWHAQSSSTLQSMNFTPCLVDPDVWMRAACKPNGAEYYEYIFVYVDLLVLSH